MNWIQQVEDLRLVKVMFSIEQYVFFKDCAFWYVTWCIQVPMYRRQLLYFQKETICQILRHMSEEIPLICHGFERMKSTSNILITERRIYRIRKIVCKDLKKTKFQVIKKSTQLCSIPYSWNCSPSK
jgi:hypothetical protein